MSSIRFLDGCAGIVIGSRWIKGLLPGRPSSRKQYRLQRLDSRHCNGGMASSHSNSCSGVVLKAPDMILRALLWIFCGPSMEDGLSFHHTSHPHVWVGCISEM